VYGLNKKNYEVLFASNLKMTESLKAELASAVGTLFKALLKAEHNAIIDALAGIIIITYLLGRRLGIEFNTIDLMAKKNLQTGIGDTKEKDQWYEDMNELFLYLDNRKR